MNNHSPRILSNILTGIIKVGVVYTINVFSLTYPRVLLRPITGLIGEAVASLCA